MMNVLKNPSFFRPSSRPSSPAPPTSRPDFTLPVDHPSRPLTKLSLSNFRRPSPARPNGGGSTPAPLVQDGSYLEVLSLKLSEAVSKALAQPAAVSTVGDQPSARKPAVSLRGHALGTLIASELQATRDSPHIHRALIRTLHRPLSVLLNNLSSQLLPIITSPAFTSAALPTPQSPYPNAVQTQALNITSLAAELLEIFDEFGLGIDGDLRGDGLKDVREGLFSLVTRVINPLLSGIRNELIPLLDALEVPSTRPGKLSTTGKASIYHPSIISMQSIVPIYAKFLARYTSSTACQTILATFLISIVWRGLIALSHRTCVVRSPIPLATQLPVPGKKPKGSPSTTPPMTPPSSRFTMKLPPSRPPSPVLDTSGDPAANDARALYDLFSLFPRPTVNIEATRLASEAVEDAFDGLKALAPLLEAAHTNKAGNAPVENVAQNLEKLTAELPMLIALPILLHSHGGPSVAEVLGIAEGEYRSGCLSGFGRAEECASVVAQRVFDRLRVRSDVDPVVFRWLELEIAEGPE